MNMSLCPRCGGHPKTFGDDKTGYTAFCNKCALRTPQGDKDRYTTRKAAKRGWNGMADSFDKEERWT